MSNTSSEFRNAVLQYTETQGWSTNIIELRDGAYIAAGSRETDSESERMLLMIVCEPESKVTTEHLEYLIEARNNKNADSALLTNTVGITGNAQSLIEKYGVDTISPETVRSHTETSGFDLGTDEISMPDSNPNTHADTKRGSDPEDQKTPVTKQSEGLTITETKPTIQHPGEDGFAVKHAIYVSVLSLVPTFILVLVLPGDFASIGLFGFPLFAYIGYQRPTAKSAFGRQSFWSAIMLLISPIMVIIHTAMFIGSETEGTAEEAGATVGGTILIILAFIVGLPLAIAFYIFHNKYDIQE